MPAVLERYKLAHADPARRAIVSEATFTQEDIAKPDDGRVVWHHGRGGHVLYLDGHATWVSIDAVRPTLVAVPADDYVGHDVALLHALDR